MKEYEMKDAMGSVNMLLSVLDWVFEKAVSGGGAAQELGAQYLRDNKGDKGAAIDSLISWQAAKAASGGFLANLGGLITLPVAVPANLAASLYIQLRMIAAIAHIKGYDIHEDKVQTLCYLCLAGDSAGEILKTAGVRIGTRVTTAAIQKYVSGAFLKAINKAVGFRLVTIAGTTGVLNLSKAVPLVGGAISAGFDFYTTKTIGQFSKNFFVQKAIGDSAGAAAVSESAEVILLPYIPAAPKGS